MTTDIIVVDVSHHQGDWPGEDTPWDAMRGAGLIGVILKATEGTTYVDPTFRRRYDAAHENDIIASSYHFLRHGGISQQMQLYLNTVDPEPGERMVLDWEDGSVTLGELKDAIEYLLNDNRNLQVTVYASASFLQENVPNVSDPVLAQTSLWVARYSGQPPYWPSAVWSTWSLWQCTDSYSVEGYGPLDGNKFNGSVEACKAWLAPAGSEPVPVPPDDEPVVLNVAPGTTVVLNGVEYVAT